MSPGDRILVVGGGGHAKVVISTLQAAGFAVEAVYDDDPAKWRSTLLGVPVTGPVARLEDERHGAGVVAIGNNATRRRIASRLSLRWVTAVHPAAAVHTSVTLGPGTVVFAGAVIQPDSAIGAHVIVNTGATVDHDCVLGDFSQVCPGVHLSGGVQVGEGAFLGTGSSAVPGARIGAWTTVGAGGVVVRNLPDGVIAVGVPARHRSQT